MKKLSIFLSAIFSVFIGVSFAASPSIVSYSYTTEGNDVKIFWTDVSNGGDIDINVQNPTTQDRLHFGTVKMSDETFVYTKQWEGDQKIWMIPGDGGEEIRFTIEGESTAATAAPAAATIEPTANRTVIPAVPKTGPDGNIIGIIIAAFVVFGGYIYIKKRADI